MKTFRLAASSVTLAAFALGACSTTAASAPQDAPYFGVYGGSYTCTDGEHGFYLDLASVRPATGGGYDADGVLGFFPTLTGVSGPAGGVAGSFAVSGTISADGDVAMTAGDWLVQPAGYGAASLEGKLRAKPGGGYALTGKPVVPGSPGACSNLIATQFLP